MNTTHHLNKLTAQFIYNYRESVSKYCNLSMINHRTISRSKKILKNLYEDIADAYYDTKNDKSIGSPKKFILKKNSETIKTFFTFDYLSIDVKNFVIKKIEEKQAYLLSYNFEIHETRYQINFAYFEKDAKIQKIIKSAKMKKQLRDLKTMIRFLKKHSDFQQDSLELNIFITPVEKKLCSPSETIGKNNVNTGVTYACSKNGIIYIYRQEEWFKTVIHEMIHSVCIDFSMSNSLQNIQAKTREIFPINSEFLLSETYCDFWAIIISSMYKAFHYIDIPYNLTLKYEKNKKQILNKRFEDFYEAFECFYYIESYWTILQSIKILDNMDLNYTDLFKTESDTQQMRSMIYKEESNVFAYYIAKSILMFFGHEFIIGNFRSNKEIIFFPNDSQNLVSFYNFIHNYYNNKKLLQAYNDIKRDFYDRKHKLNLKKLHTTLRMTIIELK